MSQAITANGVGSMQLDSAVLPAYTVLHYKTDILLQAILLQIAHIRG